MPNLFLYAHGGSGNHGCEAIVRSTLKILSDVEVEHVYLITNCPAEDQKYGLSALCELLQEKNEYSKMSLAFIKAYLSLKLKKDYVPLDKLQYKVAFDRMRPGDIAVSIGGDNYCYADAQRYTQMHDMALARGAKTVLWGCSVEPELLKNPVISADIIRYSSITVREVMSYGTLKKANPNTVLASDPAFTLQKRELPLPDGWNEGGMIGINASPLILNSGKSGKIVLGSYRTLIKCIIDTTSYDIVLVPHVVWDGNDDRQVLDMLYNEFKGTKRIIMLPDCNCMELKGYISRCRMFIGARTHATIAAYSSCVPTLVLGYSIKSIGIAKDIFGTADNYVIRVQELKDTDELVTGFKWLCDNESSIRQHLAKVIPDYIAQAYVAASALDNL